MILRYLIVSPTIINLMLELLCQQCNASRRDQLAYLDTPSLYPNQSHFWTSECCVEGVDVIPKRVTLVKRL